MNLANVISALKLPTRVVAGIALASFVLLLLPEGFLEWLGISPSYDQYRGFVGVACILCVALTIVGLAVSAGAPFVRWWTDRTYLRRARRRLHELSAEEKELLSLYFLKHTRSLALSPKDGTAMGLVKEGVLFVASERYYDPIALHSVNIQPWAWSYLDKRQALLQ